MKHLATVNQKSIYAAAGHQYEEADLIDDPVIRITLKLKCLDLQVKTYMAEQKNRAMDQLDKVHNIKTSMRNVEIKNFDSIPLVEHIGNQD